MFAVRKRSPRARALVLVVALCGASLALAACAPTSTEGSDVVETDEPVPDPSLTTEGTPDPPQPTKYGGIALGYDGPSDGDLGDFVMEDGRWCQGVTMFWSPEVPDGVTFTVDEVQIDPASFTVDEGNCDEGANTIACLDVVLGANDFFQCGVILTPLVETPPPAELKLIGTIDCVDAERCAQMEAYAADQGVTIMVCGSTSEACESRPTTEEG